MALSFENILTLMVGYSVALAGGHFITGSVVDRLWHKYLPNIERHKELPRLVGALDIFLFITSYLLGFAEFIAIWLAIKVAGEWSPSKSEVDRPLYHIFLIGNGLNLIIAIGVAIVIKAIVGL